MSTYLCRYIKCQGTLSTDFKPMRFGLLSKYGMHFLCYFLYWWQSWKPNSIDDQTFFFYRFAYFFLSHFEFRFISIFYTHARYSYRLQANGHHLISRDGFVCFPISFKIWVEKQNISFISVPTQWFVRK